MATPAQTTKRRRDADDDDIAELSMGKESKKFKALPIRSPPASKQSTFFSQQSTHTYRPISALLTPVESSDDDLDESILDFETDQLPPLEDSNTSSGSSASSIKVIVGDDGDADMEMVDFQPRSQFSSPQPWQRQRSNDMLSPPRLPHLLDTHQRIGNDRLPTPIYGHFSSNDVNMDAVGNGSGISMSLSPLIREEEESHWWRGRRLPSPVDNADEHMSSVGQADGMMGRLNVNNVDNVDPTRPYTSILNGTSLWPPVVEQQSGRSASEAVAHRAGRLTMGFRADCDKCIRRVPGHYSHIVRDQKGCPFKRSFSTGVPLAGAGFHENIAWVVSGAIRMMLHINMIPCTDLQTHDGRRFIYSPVQDEQSFVIYSFPASQLSLMLSIRDSKVICVTSIKGRLF